MTQTPKHDSDGRTSIYIEGRRVRRVADHLRKRQYSIGTPYERALARVSVDDRGCWNWQGAKVPAGYGHINVGGGKYRYAHIVTYEHHNGTVPEGLELDHLCRNRGCVNPDHLEAVTHAENVRRGDAMLRKCSHPDDEFSRRKDSGQIVYCRACRREARRRTPKVAHGMCETCNAPLLGRSDKRYCSAPCRRLARTKREKAGRT